uniref:Cytochrome c oxidase assembly factor 8 n=1 Tax=Oryzias sinensis TaxID=183150 RepID=A0A8C7YIZ6_9TELE
MTFGAAGRSSWRSARNSRVQLLDVNIRRNGSNPTSQQDKAAKRTPLRPEPSSTHDWIGPPNPLSNLRPIIYRIPEEESELEKRLRNLRQETEDWNHKFWTQQNLNFSEEKEAFVVSQLAGKGLTLRDVDGRRRSLSSEEMAVFYKSFLDKNRKHHASYNKEWYRRNFTITWLMGRVVLSSVWRTLTGRWNSSPTL